MDLSYEKYFQNKAYVFSSVAFYKKLTSYIYAIGVPYDFSQLNSGLPPGYLGPAWSPRRMVSFNIQQNGQGGRVDGAELAASLPGELFSDYLTGFGVLASVSRHGEQHSDSRLGGRHHVYGYHLAGTVEKCLAGHRILRALWLFGTHCDTLSFQLHGGNHRFRRRPRA